MKLKRNSRWTVSYIDLLMTILGFFVLLYAREHDPKEVADSLRSAFNHEDHNRQKNNGAGGNALQSDVNKTAPPAGAMKANDTNTSNAKDDNKSTTDNCLTKTGAACPTQDFLADDLFSPQDAILTDKGKATLAQFAKKAVRASAYFMIESHGIGNGTARFDKWELAAARTASVARQLKSSGVDEDHLKIMMAPDNPLADNGQHLLITISKENKTIPVK